MKKLMMTFAMLFGFTMLLIFGNNCGRLTSQGALDVPRNPAQILETPAVGSKKHLSPISAEASTESHSTIQ